MRATAESSSELAVTGALCVWGAAMLSSIVSSLDPIWWMLGLFVGFCWGGIVAIISGAVLFGALFVVRNSYRSDLAVLIPTGLTAGGAIWLFIAFVLMQDPTVANVALVLLTALVAAVLVRARLRAQRRSFASPATTDESRNTT